MHDPYATMGLDSSADEQTVRARYLELVRQFPPDREPARFADIRRAYEELRDPVHRLRRQLLDFERHDSFDLLLGDLRRRVRQRRLPAAALISLGEVT